MITGTDLRKIRKSFGLKIREVSRATNISESAISNIEKGNKSGSIDIIEILANFYGYSTGLNAVERKRRSKKINFYKPKSVKQLLKLSKEDLTEYLYVTLDYDAISRLVNIEEEALKCISLNDLRDILGKSIEKLDNLAVYYKMEGIYEGIEREVVETIDYFVKELDSNKENASVDKFLSSIYYIDLDMTYDYEYEEWDTYYDDIKVYDKKMNLLGTSQGYVKNDNDNDCISLIIEEMAVAWRNDNIDNQELMRALIEPLQIRF